MSDFRVGQCLEWCTQLPLAHSMRESPIFLLQGEEFFFRFIHSFIDLECYSVYLMIKNKKSYFKPCRFTCQVGFKYEKNLILQEEEFEVSRAFEVWYVLKREIIPMLPYDYYKGNWIKFLFRFENVLQPLLKCNNRTEMQLKAVGSQVFQERRQESSDSRKNIHFEALSRDFSKLLQESSNYDVEITCEDKTIKAHRIVLETRSRVFSAMLKSNMIEGKSGLITVKDIKASIFQYFISYLYSGTLPELSMRIAKELYETADKYDVEELKTPCSEFLTKNVSEGNACELLIFADQHSDEDFRKNIMSYIVNEKIPKIETHWSNFKKSYPILALDVANLYIQKY